MKAVDSLVLPIAHRLATVKNCDQIIVLDNGEIVEQGSHEELLQKQGRYYQLWELQQGNFVIREDEPETPTLPEVSDEEEMSY